MVRRQTAGPSAWRLSTVVETVAETPRATSVVVDEPGWAGHCPGQHLDLRLTAEGGYQAQCSHSIASPPEDPRVAITVERMGDGEVSPYLTDGLRGPIGGCFAWQVEAGGPRLPVAGGSGVVPPMAMLRHGDVPARPLVAGPLVIHEQSRAGHRLLATAAGSPRAAPARRPPTLVSPGLRGRPSIRQPEGGRAPRCARDNPRRGALGAGALSIPSRGEAKKATANPALYPL